MTDFAKRLQTLIDKENISQTDVAAGIGVDGAMVSLWLNRKVTAPRRKTIVKLATFFDCDINWLATGTGEPFPKPNHVTMTQHIGNVAGHVQQVHGDFHGNLIHGGSAAHKAPGKPVERESSLAELRNIPVLGRVPDDIPNVLRENVETYVSLPDTPPDCFALKIKDDAMAPQFIQGDYVLFVIDRRPAVGDIVVVNDEWGDSMIRRLKVKGGEQHLVSDTPVYLSYRADADHRIMGVVIGGWRTLKVI